MLKRLLIFSICSSLIYITLSSHSKGGASLSGADGTGARGGGGCSCHGPNEDKNLSISMELDSAGIPVNHYVPGGQYTVKMTSINYTNVNMPKFGFRLATVGSGYAGTPSATNLGDYPNDIMPMDCQITSVASFKIVEHSTPLVGTQGNGGKGTVYTQSIPWTAPDEDSGPAVFYGVILGSNDNGKESGDKWSKSKLVINELRRPLEISGGNKVCLEDDLQLIANKPGGYWTSNTPNIAEIGTNSGIVHGEAPGVALITYTYRGNKTTVAITVEAKLTDVSEITGLSSVCAGTPTQMNQAYKGGTWSSSNNEIATVSSKGVVTGLSAGECTITFSAEGTCGNLTKTKPIKVFRSPNPGKIVQPPFDWCMGSVVNLTASVRGGKWSTSNSNALVTGEGNVVGQYPGTDTIIYTVKEGLCTASTSVYLTFYEKPVAGTITGPWGLRVKNKARLVNTVSGGKWSSSNSCVAIGPTGELYGVSEGEAIITYTVSNGPCSDMTTHNIKVFTKDEAVTPPSRKPVDGGN